MDTGTVLHKSRVFFLLAAFCSPAWSGGLAVLETVLTDNGDGDGFADTRETVGLRLRLQNTSGATLTGVSVRIVPVAGAGYMCLTDDEIAVGDLAPGQTLLTTEAFSFTVGDVDRTALSLTAFDDLSVIFDILATASPSDPPVYPPKLALDLDLDTVGGSGPTEYFETFESGDLGSFEIQNLDLGKSSLAASDGYRCQYNDPDNPKSNTYGAPPYNDNCYLGASPLQAEAVFWNLSGPAFSPLGGRAFTGFHSLFWGVDFGPPDNWTTPSSVLEAVRTAQPIHLAASGDPPVLSFKHQVSLVDDRCIPGIPDISYDRGVVMAQFADDTGAPVGPWIKLDPFQNVHDRHHLNNYYNCAFDPVDDGNTEDDFFFPTVPRYGPTTTCYPEYTFASLGETSNPFNAANLGRADGPGLAGQWGIGTWVESKYDLGRFRGRSIRLRFLVSALETAPFEDTWEDLFQWNPISCDDGWWIDDVHVTRALTTAVVVTPDVHDNTGLPGTGSGDLDGDGQPDVCDNCPATPSMDQQDPDFDGLGNICDACPYDPTNYDPDGDTVCAESDNCTFVANLDQANADNDPFGAACDCNDNSLAVYPGHNEWNDGIDNQCPGDPGYGQTDEVTGPTMFETKSKLSWMYQPYATQYQVVRARSATLTAGCTTFPLSSQTFLMDSTNPLPGSVLFYVKRATLPNKGSWGQTSSGQERVAPCAP